MKLLIVEDNPSLAELTAGFLHFLDGQAQQIEAITLAADLQSAMSCLCDHDVVLCDGTFPLAPGADGFASEEWDVIYWEARRRKTHFVLYSGSARALDLARESKIPVLAKPAAIAEIYAAVMGFPLPVTPRGY